MQQSCIRQLIFRIGRITIIGRRNYNVNNTNNKATDNKHHDNALICPIWEEAIIKEHRKPDIPIDLMQRETIVVINNKAIDNEHRDNTLICTVWEEAIIKEHRKPDIPIDLMQKDTIDTINNNNKNIKQ